MSKKTVEVQQSEIKLRAGKYMFPVVQYVTPTRIFFKFAFNRALLNEIKCMESAKWHGYDGAPKTPDGVPTKVWSIKQSQRNNFQLKYLQGGNPYEEYDQLLPEIDLNGFDHIDFFDHQRVGISHLLTRKQCILAADMGLGKTLMAMVAMMLSGVTNWWWIGPKSALRSVAREFKYWKCPLEPSFLTYEALTKAMKEWPEGMLPPPGVVGDEFSRVKSPTSQRSQAFQALANGMRDHYGESAYIWGMSGACAPRNPTDWWKQAEIACPGFLREGNIHKFKERLAVLVEGHAMDGTTYKKPVAWKDGSDVCGKCGQAKDEAAHKPELCLSDAHDFEPCENEVEKLYARLKGLVLVQRKDECLDLPERIFQVKQAEPSKATLRLVGLVTAKAATVIEGLTLLRELSDGFQYRGEGNDRVAEQVPCPKEDMLVEDLQSQEDTGRVIIYAGFTGSVDRCVHICLREGWDVVRVDGRGWHVYRMAEKEREVVTTDPLEYFATSGNKVAFVGQPGAGGMGLNLQNAVTTIFYSNTFNAEDRFQSMERNYRIGSEKGVVVIDYVHLPSDRKVLENLRVKRNLLGMTLGEFIDANTKEAELATTT